MTYRHPARHVFSNRLRLLAAGLFLLASTVAQAGKVLYVTHEPGRWHDYSAQLADFREVAGAADWTLTVATGDKDDLFTFLRSEAYAEGQDVIVYNFCLADSRDMAAMTSLINQTVERGVPAVLVHCAMHSWWDTFKKGRPIPGNALGEARANKRLLKQWQEHNPDQPLPAWGDFTGIASTKHGPKKPIRLVPVEGAPVTLDIPADYETKKTELYNNHYVTPDVIPLLRGIQRDDDEVVMWLAPRGEGQVIGLTLGHNDDEWDDPVFRGLLKSAIDYLLEPQ